MARDYAKRNNATARTSPASKPRRCWLWLVTGLVIGLATHFLSPLSQQPTGPRTEMTMPPLASSKPVTKPQAEVDRPEVEPRFDFYSILPEMEVVVPEPEVPPPPATETEAHAAKPRPTSGRYILQVGSFKQFADADQLKAKLALMGIIAGIQRVTINDKDWHRVRIGPYNNLDQIKQVRKKLEAEQIQAILLKVSS